MSEKRPAWHATITDEERAWARAYVARGEPNPTAEELPAIGLASSPTEAATLRQVETARCLVRRLRLTPPRLDEPHRETLERQAASEGQEPANYMSAAILPVAAWLAVHALPTEEEMLSGRRQVLSVKDVELTLEARAHQAARQILGGTPGTSATPIEGGRRDEDANPLDVAAPPEEAPELPDAPLIEEAERREAAARLNAYLRAVPMTPFEARLIALAREHEDWTHEKLAQALGVGRPTVTQSFTRLRIKGGKIIQTTRRIR